MATKMVATWRVAKATLFLELLHSVGKNLHQFTIQSNPVNAETKGIIGICIKRIGFRENVRAFFFPRDKANCP